MHLGNFCLIRKEPRGKKCQLRWNSVFVLLRKAASSGVDSGAVGSFNASSTSSKIISI